MLWIRWIKYLVPFADRRQGIVLNVFFRSEFSPHSNLIVQHTDSSEVKTPSRCQLTDSSLHFICRTRSLPQIRLFKVQTRGPLPHGKGAERAYQGLSTCQPYLICSVNGHIDIFADFRLIIRAQSKSAWKSLSSFTLMKLIFSDE